MKREEYWINGAIVNGDTRKWRQWKYCQQIQLATVSVGLCYGWKKRFGERVSERERRRRGSIKQQFLLYRFIFRQINLLHQ